MSDEELYADFVKPMIDVVLSLTTTPDTYLFIPNRSLCFNYMLVIAYVLAHLVVSS